MLVFSEVAICVEPVVQWETTFGGADTEEGYSVQQTADGGYIVAGYTFSYGFAYDAYLVKTDSAGNMQWQKTFGAENRATVGYCVRQTYDGGYIVGGSSSYVHPEYNAYLVKTDSQGNMQWEKTFGGPGLDMCWSVQQTKDGGYIAAGDTESLGGGSRDVYLIKTDSSGNLQWQKAFGGPDWENGFSVQQTVDGGYVIAGRTLSYGSGYDVYLVKTDASGNLQWQKTFGEGDEATGYSVQQTYDGGYVIAGETVTYGSWYHVYLIKTDSSGNSQWQKALGGYGRGHSVQQTLDGGYIIAGWGAYSAETSYDAYLVKTDSLGQMQWDKYLGRNTGEIPWDYGYSVQQTNDGGYIVGGSTFFDGGPGATDFYLIKLGPEVSAVHIDIKPGSCPNPLNVKDSGLLSVAICGEVGFDVWMVDMPSVRLEGVAPVRSSYEDVATPMPDGAQACECTTAGRDGRLDLTLKFNVQDILAALGPVNNGDVLELTLTGELNDGTPIEGRDCIVVRGAK